MFKKKWLIALAVFGLLCLAALGTVCIVLFVEHVLPSYTTQQIPSLHPGYRRTMLLSGSAVYVNDYEEYSLRLINPEPTQVIGRYGTGKVCAIPGQSTSAYIAADCGSEMPAYEVFRNSQARPFDWRTAAFQKMQFTGPSGSGVNLFTTNQTLITDVLHTLSEGAPVTTPLSAANRANNIAGICLFSDQLPGMVFCPAVYLDPTGQVYLTESVAIGAPGSQPPGQTQWISASRPVADWVHSH
jgi:hypothetical protein